jgi:hypothetical protein
LSGPALSQGAAWTAWATSQQNRKVAAARLGVSIIEVLGVNSIVSGES